MLIFPSEANAHTSKEEIIFVQIFRKLVLQTHCEEFEEKSQMRKSKKNYITLGVQMKQNISWETLLRLVFTRNKNHSIQNNYQKYI